MMKSKIDQDAKILVCKKCAKGIIIFENNKGDVLNLKYVNKFLDKHEEVDLMVYGDFVSRNRTELKLLKT